MLILFNLSLNNNSGIINISNFSNKYYSLTIIPIVTKGAGFERHIFSLNIETTEAEEDVETLLLVIENLIKEIEALQMKINTLLGVENSHCGQIVSNLLLGTRGGNVECLQQFLKDQGTDIYPEGLVTGYFGPLTKVAVIRFQEKYKAEILSPLGLEKGTGYVGPSTRKKINSLL